MNSNTERWDCFGGELFSELVAALLRNRAVLIVLFVVDGAVHLAGVPIVLGEYWLLQELYSGFASENLGVLMFDVPLLLILGVLFLVMALLVWRGRGRLFGAFLVCLSILNGLLGFEVMQRSWRAAAFSVVGVLLGLLILASLVVLRYQSSAVSENKRGR